MCISCQLLAEPRKIHFLVVGEANIHNTLDYYKTNQYLILHTLSLIVTYKALFYTMRLNGFFEDFMIIKIIRYKYIKMS